MKIQILVVDLELSPRSRKLFWHAAVTTAVLLVGAGVAYAAFPDPVYKAGDALTAESLNKNFALAAPPPGTIVAYGGEIDKNPGEGTGAPVHPAPEGWLLCDGMQLNGLDLKYNALYKAIGVAHGGNTTSQSFNLPDLRGMFLRGVDGTGSGSPAADPNATTRTAARPGGNIGNKVGSTQGGVFAEHNHGGGDHSHGYAIPNYTVAVGSGPYPDGLTANSSVRLPLTSTSSGKIVALEGGAETRPKNIYVNYIIKL